VAPRWWRRRRRRGSAARAGEAAARQAIAEFASTRLGVEGFVEPRTAVSDTTVVLVARDGEWLRRRMPDPRAAHTLCNDLQIPSYDAAVVGYPDRMRDWSGRQRDADRRLTAPDTPEGD